MDGEAHSQGSGGGELAAPRERRDAAARRQRILAVARELFACQGVDATSMHEIAQTAGVGQGTLYRRYAHKGDLCAALLQDSIQRFQAEAAARLAGAGAALDQLTWFLGRLAAFNEENAALLGAIGDAACGQRRHAAYCNPFYCWQRGTAAALLERAVAQGETAGLDVAITADLLLSMLSIDMYLYQRRTLGHTPERIVAAVLRVALEGLRAAGGCRAREG